MLNSIEFLSQSGVKFDFNNHTHVSICKVSTFTTDFLFRDLERFRKITSSFLCSRTAVVIKDVQIRGRGRPRE